LKIITTDRNHVDICTNLHSRLTAYQSKDYSWCNLAGTPLDSLAKAAVLVPLVVTGDDSVEVWLTKRSDKVRTDKGHVSFPGGMKEVNDANAVQTCLREANEEIGLHSDQVSLIINSCLHIFAVLLLL